MNLLFERLREADSLVGEIRASKWLARLPGDVVYIEDDIDGSRDRC
jgi:hypothetical protein